MKKEKLLKKINILCCKHRQHRNRYLVGYVGLKIFPVALCLDCEKHQFLGRKWLERIYNIVKNIFRNRVTVIGGLDIEPIFDEEWGKELEKYGRDRQ